MAVLAVTFGAMFDGGGATTQCAQLTTSFCIFRRGVAIILTVQYPLHVFLAQR